VPVDKRLMAENKRVEIFAPYYQEKVRLVYDARKVPNFNGTDSLVGKRIGVEKISIAGMVMLGTQNGKFRDAVKIYPTAIEALRKMKEGEVDAVVANRSEIEYVVKDDPNFRQADASFERLPQQGWVIGMAVKKEETDLARAVQEATNEIVASGEMAKIFLKHGVQPVKP
jgi:ABC-type amino acid transport substrate-binding protein